MIHLSFLSIRQALGLTPSQAADLLRVSPATYKRWESLNPSDQLEAWAAVATGTAISHKTPSAVRALRKAASLTQGQAASLAGVKPLAWVRWESGHVAAPAWRMVLFASRVDLAREEAPVWVPLTGPEVQAARVGAGLTLRQAADLVYSGAAVNWSAVEEGRELMPRHVWELFLFKAAAPGRPAPGLPSADVIRAARKAAGLTQGQAADRVGVKRSTWAAWEAGRNQPDRAAWELWLHKG